MRIAWFSNSPDVPTGYGVQTMQVASRMAQDGHEVHILGNFGHRSGAREMAGMTVWPEGVENYSLDIATELADLVDADVVFTLYDVWVMKQEWANRRVVSWTPVDHFPPPPGVLKWARAHDTIAMSEDGARQLRENGIEPIATIHHGIEDVYRPTEGGRKRLGVPEGAFVVMINAANIGTTPPRKSWSENLQAIAAMMRRHPDVFLYLHTDLAKPTGVPLPVLIELLQIPRERVLVAHPLQYRIGAIGADEMAQFYTAADVLLAVSMGEGFGIPVIEAMACGTPAIVSNFSAQPELVGDNGWKVPGQLEWDHNQGPFFFQPFVDGITSALEDAYTQSKDRATWQALSDACVASARERFRADDLYERHWRPLLARIEAESKEPPRKGMSRGAKKRAGKAA